MSNTSEVLPPNFFAVKQSQARRDAEARIEVAKAHIKELREEADREEKRLKESAKAQRDQAREDDRRALLVGHVLLKSAGENINTWNNVWPKLVKSLAESSETDRALFELPAMPRRGEKQVSDATTQAATDPEKVPAVAAPAATDQKQGSEAAASTTDTDKKEGSETAAPTATDSEKKEPAKAANDR